MQRSQVNSSTVLKTGAIAGVMVVVVAFGLFSLEPALSANNSQQTSENDRPVPQLEKKAPEAKFTTTAGKEVKLSDFRGEKVMLWFLATWCPSCKMGAKVLGDNYKKLKDLEVVAVKNYGNAGYGGPSISEFAKDFPATLNYDNWVWGNATKRTSRVYNPRYYPDIYYLIDEEGIVRNVDGTPSATLDKIVSFAQE